MMKNISETLAGRVAVLNLLPLSLKEINGIENGVFHTYVEELKNKKFLKHSQEQIFENIFRGGLPKIVADNIDREMYYSSYMNTYIERDASSLEKVGKLEEFRNFVTYMAANTAQELKYDSISKVIGVLAQTIKEWVSILERFGIIYILRPYNNSISKRLVRIPKCYFLDTELAAYLTSWPTAKTLENGAASVAFFETYVISETLKSYYNNGREPNLFYYRDVDQREIDLLMVEGDKIYPIEIKRNKNPTNPTKNFDVLKKFNLTIMPSIIICMSNEFVPYNKNCWLCPLELI